jgi:hypothetical protein
MDRGGRGVGSRDYFQNHSSRWPFRELRCAVSRWNFGIFSSHLSSASHGCVTTEKSECLTLRKYLGFIGGRAHADEPRPGDRTSRLCMHGLFRR